MERGSETKPKVAYWPADPRELFREATVGDALRETAETWPDDCGLVAARIGAVDRQRWSYAQLLEEGERVARALVGRFQPGERVAIWAPNTAEWLLLQYGAALAGITLVPVNPAFRSRELAYVLGQSCASGVFLVTEFRGSPMADFLEAVRGQLPELREVVDLAGWDDFLQSGSPSQRLPKVSPEHASQIQYTGGTTGFPKGVLLHHRGILNCARFVAERLQVEPGERWLNFLPLFHVAGARSQRWARFRRAPRRSSVASSRAWR